MTFSGRTRELGRIRAVLDTPRPQILRVFGIRGGGKSTLVERAAQDYRAVLIRLPPVTDPELGAEVLRRVRAEAGRLGIEETGPSGSDSGDGDVWRAALEAASRLSSPSGPPAVLVLDDAHRLSEARSRLIDAAIDVLSKAAEEERTLHLIFVGPEDGLPTMEESDSIGTRSIEVGPLPLRAAVPHLPGARPHDLVRAYGIFGGLPRVLTRLDRTVTIGTNVRRLILAGDGRLSSAVEEWLETDVQTPARYVSILRTCARGDADWGRLHRGVPDLTSSGQVAPYLKRLGELGLIEAHRSLDSAPRGRSTRYRSADPFFSFWFRFALHRHYAGREISVSEYYQTSVRPLIDEYLEVIFPQICRQHLEFDSVETLGAVAREGGSLWGAEIDIPVAGILRSGAAYYGACRWQTPSRASAPLAELDRQINETRYGFGRERRLRLLFTGIPAPVWLRREIARRHDAELIDAEALVGT